MNSLPEILDISSDEELGREEYESVEELGPAEPKASDYDWLSELLGVTDEKIDDFDDVVVVGEVNPIKKRTKSRSWKPTVKDVDDDCVILDGDPDNPVAIENESADGSEELLIVGEKGQVACRDYPHARHLCTKFPFSSTPHEKYCELCHCYVCDSIAPCHFWCVGSLMADHCHATDREEVWKIQRSSFKLRRSTSLPIPASKVHPSPTVPLPHHLGPRGDIIQLTPRLTPKPILWSHSSNLTRPTNSMIRNQIPLSTAVNNCSTNFTVPNILSQGRNRPSGLSKNIYQPRSVSQPWLGVRSNAIHKDRVHDIHNLRSRFLSCNTMFKRTTAVGGATTTIRSLGQNVVNRPSPPVLPHPPTLLDCRTPSRWQDTQPSMNSELYTQQGSNLDSVRSTSPSQMVEYSQHIPQPTNSQFYQRQNIENGIYQPGNQTQSATQINYQQENQSQSAISQIQEVTCVASESSEYDLDQLNNNYGRNQSLVENSQFQSAGSINEPPPAKEPKSNFTADIINTKLVGREFENYLFEPESAPEVADWFVPGELNGLYPQPPVIDAGMLLFDFETSWDGLTQV